MKNIKLLVLLFTSILIIPLLTIASDFRDETIYFVITTRFNDGDPNNNYYNRDRLKLGDPQWRGDFKGLIQQLDYIKELGFTAIWITPPIENRSGLDYHGYHGYDWNKIDPRLESPGATYQDLINAIHSKGMKIIQDVVVNHSSQYGVRGQVWINHLPIKYYRPQGVGQINHGPYKDNLGDYRQQNRMDDDNPAAPVWYKERYSMDPLGIVPLLDMITKVTIPNPNINPNRFFGFDVKTLDPSWYHLDGFMAGGDWESPRSLQRKHMAGDCVDFATENDVVKNYINNAVFKYLDMGVDAIRIDTIKHIERDNLLEYVNAWKNHKKDLFVFGENLVKGTGYGDLGGDNGPSEIRPWWYTRLGHDPHNPNSGGDSGLSVLDFPLFSTFRDNVTRGSFSGIGGVLSMDWIYGNSSNLVTFFQNHDVGPDNDFKYRFGGDMNYAKMAYNLLWTIRGIPTLYYGEEIQFQGGKPQDISGNNDTLDMTGRAYYGDNLVSDRIMSTKNHPLYKHIQNLNRIRRNVIALRRGSFESVNEWGSGMSFVRRYQNSLALIGLAASDGQNIEFNGLPSGIYRDEVSGNKISVNDGKLRFYVPAFSLAVYVIESKN